MSQLKGCLISRIVSLGYGVSALHLPSIVLAAQLRPEDIRLLEYESIADFHQARAVAG